MMLFLLAYLGGVLTIVSPCILPVLPFVFARADKPFLKSGLPVLFGMSLTFAVVASLAAVGGEWAADANQYARYIALAVLAVFGAALLFPAIAEVISRPFVAAGAQLSDSIRRAESEGASPLVPSLLLGVATGLLWAPCAGPVLGLILTGAALQGASVGTSLLLFGYAAGAATSLALALLAGGKILAAMKRSLGAMEWVRRGLGAAVLAAVAAIALGLDTGFLTRLSAESTTALEQGLLDRFHRPEPAAMAGGNMMMSGSNTAMMSANPAMMAANPSMMMSGSAAGSSTETLVAGGPMPELNGVTAWLNAQPLTTAGLKGKVVLIDFWTYSCINCLRAIPYVRAWAEKYKDQGLVVIGVHSPEFAFEKRLSNVKKAIVDLKITYPVAVDNDYAVWRSYNNRYWPAHYFIDAEGKIRHHHFGEGGYDESERVIQKLLAEAGKAGVADDLVAVNAVGVEAASATEDVASPETYIGYERAENFVSPEGAAQDAARTYTDGKPRLNEWGLSGNWTINKEHAVLNAAKGKIVYRFRARDLHLVLGPSANGAPVPFRISIDSKAPGDSRGLDVDADGRGTVTEQRLYQLFRADGPVTDHTFEIEFMEPGVEAYAFTFG